MTLRLSPPIRFLATVLLLWAAIRVVTFTPIEHWREALPSPMLFAGSDGAPPGPLAAPASVRAERSSAMARSPGRYRALPIAVHFAAATASTDIRDRSPGLVRAYDERAYMQMMLAAFAPRIAQPMLMRFGGAPQRGVLPGSFVTAGAPASRWRFSAWTLLRGEKGAPSLASAGQLGGSQAGFAASYRLSGSPGRPLLIFARLTRPVRSNGAETAIGLSAQPLAGAPVTLAAERRIALERGGRNAWALGVYGGVDRVRLPLALELDAWAQSGIVGANSRDLYADGACRSLAPGTGIGRRRVRARRRRLGLGPA